MSMSMSRIGAAVVIGALSFGALAGGGGEGAAGEAAKQASAKPAIGLQVGDKAPDAAMMTKSGESMRLADVYAKGPVIVVFYRGGWCPFCTKSLLGWDAKLDEVKAAGATLVAVTMEKPGFIAETTNVQDLDFMVLSDANAEAAKGFKLLFDLDETTQQKYKGYNIDLSSKNANGQWQLPHPGAFIIDKEGVVRYAWAQEDYRTRVSPDEVLAALKAL